MNQSDLHTWSTDFERFAADAMSALGEPMHAYQADLVGKLAPALHALRAKQVADCRKYWVEWTKGAGKDRILALAVMWLVGFTGWPVEVVAGAVDLEQCKELAKRARDVLKALPVIGRIVGVQTERLVNRQRTGGACEIVPADRYGSHGGNPDMTVVNEMSHQVDPTFAQNLLDNATKSKHGVVVCASNAGAVVHWSWPWRETARESGAWCFHQVSHPAPHIAVEDLAEAEKRNPPSRFRRLYWGQWASGSGDALDGGWIDRAITLPGSCREHPGPEWSCVAGVDAGLTRDFAAVAVVAKHVGGFEHKHGGETRRMTRMEKIMLDVGPLFPAEGYVSRAAYDAWADRSLAYRPPGTTEPIVPTGVLKLLHVWVRRPRGGEIDLGEIETEVMRCRSTYRLGLVCFDPWQMADVARRLRRKGARMTSVDPTGGNLTTQAKLVLEAFRENKVELYPDEGLLRDLRSMSLVERSYGFRLESPRTREHGHGDAGTAFVLALYAASKVKNQVTHWELRRRMGVA